MAEAELMTPLDTLASEINELHGQIVGAARMTVDLAIQCGKKLAEAKRDCGHGNFSSWLAENFDANAKTAQRYLACARGAEKGWLKNDSESFLGINEAADLVVKNEKRAKRTKDNAATLDEIDEAERETYDPADLGTVSASEGATREPVEPDARRKVAQIAQRLESAQAIVGAAVADMTKLVKAAEGTEADWLTGLLGWVKSANDDLVEFVELGMSGGGL